MKKAIVTLTVGDRYERMFDKYCRPNWQRYCDTFGYELIAVSDLLDLSERAKRRSAAWQKLLILSQPWSREYDRIVWIDADVIINNSHAYDISNGVPEERVGAVEAYSIPTREIRDIAISRLYHNWSINGIPYLDNKEPHQYYTNRGIAGEKLNAVVQTGVLVCSPQHHREIFEHIYHHYDDTHGAEWNYEMPALSYELVKTDRVYWISPRFNFCVMNILTAFYPELVVRKGTFWDKAARLITGRLGVQLPATRRQRTSLRNVYDLSIFMHFAGCPDMMADVASSAVV